MKKNLSEKLDQIIAALSEGKDDLSIKLMSQCRHVKYVIKLTEFDLLPEAKAVRMNSLVTAAHQYMTNNDQIKRNVEAFLSEFPLPINSKRTKSESSEIIEQIKEYAETQLEEIKTKKESLEVEISELEIKNNTLSKQVKRLEERSDKEATRLDTLVSSEQIKFTEKKGSIDTKYAEVIETLATSIKTFESEKETEFEAIISEARKSNKKIEGLYNLASKTSVSGFFAQKAKGEEKRADGLQIFAGVLYVLVALVPILIYCFDSDKSLNVNSVFRQFLVGITILVPAIYFSREAQKHRQEQFDYQKLGVRTQAFEPFIEKLPDEEATELRKTMIIEWFTDKEKDKEKKEPIIGHSLNKIIKLIEAISKLNITN